MLHISVTNLIIIVVMVVVFVLALVLPFPGHDEVVRSGEHRDGREQLDGRLRERLAHTVPAGQVLPDRQPAYVCSWIYVFGVLTLAALVVVSPPAACWPSVARSGGTPRP